MISIIFESKLGIERGNAKRIKNKTQTNYHIPAYMKTGNTKSPSKL